MRTLNCEALESRENPVAVGFDPVNDLVSVTLDRGAHTVSVDALDASSTKVTVDGVPAAVALSKPAGLPPLTVAVFGQATSKLVAQNNTAQNWVAVGGAGDDTIYGGPAAVNSLVGLGGNDILYSIVGGSQIDAVTGRTPGSVDRIFVNPASAVAKLPTDEQTNFFAGGATPGSGVFRQDANGQLTITPTNNGSFVQLDEVAPGTVVASYDLGDGRGPQARTFSNVTTVAYFGGSGQDVFVDNTGRDIAAYGGAGNDFLLGGLSGVKIEKGLAGNDSVLSRSRDHSDLSGNAGSDVIVDFGAGDAVFRVDSADAVAAGGFRPGDLIISP